MHSVADCVEAGGSVWRYANLNCSKSTLACSLTGEDVTDCVLARRQVVRSPPLEKQARSPWSGPVLSPYSNRQGKHSLSRTFIVLYARCVGLRGMQGSCGGFGEGGGRRQNACRHELDACLFGASRPRDRLAYSRLALL